MTIYRTSGPTLTEPASDTPNNIEPQAANLALCHAALMQIANGVYDPVLVARQALSAVEKRQPAPSPGSSQISDLTAP